MTEQSSPISPAMEAWIQGDMRRAQQLSGATIAEDAPVAPAEEVPAWLKTHLATEQLRPQPTTPQSQEQADNAMVSHAVTQLSELGDEGRALVAEWGGHTSQNFKENLQYAKSAFADIAKTRPDLIHKFDASGLGNDPEVLKVRPNLDDNEQTLMEITP